MSKKKKRKNSRRKGKDAELEAKDELNRLFGTDCRRSQQFCGKAGDADVVGLEGIFIEVKRRQSFSIDKTLETCAVDIAGGDFEVRPVPLILHRKDDTQWKATIPLNDLPALVERLNEIMKESRQEN